MLAQRKVKRQAPLHDGGQVQILNASGRLLLGARAPSPAQRAQHAQNPSLLDYFEETDVRASRSMRARAPDAFPTSRGLSKTFALRIP